MVVGETPTTLADISVALPLGRSTLKGFPASCLCRASLFIESVIRLHFSSCHRGVLPNVLLGLSWPTRSPAPSQLGIFSLSVR